MDDKSNSKYDVFISCRRKGGLEMASRIYDALNQRKYNVFFAEQEFQTGKKDTQSLDSIIDSVQDFVLILSPGGLKRCKKKNDRVKEEIRSAILKHKNIVLVFLKDFSFPAKMPQGLESLLSLPNSQRIGCCPENFDNAMDQLETRLLSRPYDVFISYRRETGFEIAKLVCEALDEKGYKVFLDVDELGSGAFDTKLYDVIDTATDFIPILSSGSLSRCVNKADWVRKEILHAIEKEKNIVPVRARDFGKYPNPMPPGLESIPDLQAINYSPEYFNDAITKLAKTLKAKPYIKIDNFGIADLNADNEKAPGKHSIWKIILIIFLLIIVTFAGLCYLGYRAEEDEKIEEARRQAVIEEQKREAERRAKEEEAERRTEQERQRLKAEHQAEQERLRLEAERRAERERLRVEAEHRAEQERLRLEAERKLAAVQAAEAQAKLEVERKLAEIQAEKARIEAKLRADIEAAERKAKEEAEARAREEARIAAERKAKEEAEARAREEARIAAERKAKEDAEAREEARIAAERKAKEDAEARAREEARIAAERKAKEDAEARKQARLAALRKVREEAARKRAKLAAQPKSKREAWIAKAGPEVKSAAEYIKHADLSHPTLNDAVMAARCADVNALQTIRNNGFSDWRDPEIILAASQTPFCANVQFVHKQGGKINAKDKYGKTVLMFAAEQPDNVETVKYLISSGADIEAEEKHGYTALMLASFRVNNVETVEYLITHGADVNAKDDDDWAVIMLACRISQNDKNVKCLADHGADVNAKVRNGRTALMVAANTPNNSETVKCLVDHGANVNAKRNDGKTALMYAARTSKNFEAVKYLADHGADVNAKDDDGKTALMYASQDSNNIESVKFLARFRSAR